ncbi:MAG: urease accessory protein UreE [Rhizobiaceae bacterium]
MLTASRFLRNGEWSDAAWDVVVLAHDQRHLRRKVLRLEHGEEVLVDLEAAISLDHGDVLVLADGRLVEVIAGEEDLLEVLPQNALHLSELCWHIGNRHLAAQIEERRVLVLKDHVIKAMLEGLGAHVHIVSEPFHPARGAYSGHGGHGHDHGHFHGHRHD